MNQYIIIPPDFFEDLLKLNKNKQLESMGELEKKFHSTYASSENDYERLTQYLIHLRSFLNKEKKADGGQISSVSEEINIKPKSNNESDNTVESQVSRPTPSEDEREKHILENNISYEPVTIVNFIPKIYQSKASRLINWIKTFAPHIKWNSKAELVIKEKVLVDSSIIDLITYAVAPPNRYNKLFPNSWEIFISELKENNAPKTLYRAQHLTQKQRVLPKRGLKNITKVRHNLTGRGSLGYKKIKSTWLKF